MNTRHSSTSAAGPRRSVRPASRRSEKAFTMVEIAIALGVIGFALVAIIGILPAGLQVQRDNRAETIINQDGTLWLDAIRSGARGVDDLTNYVDGIEVIERDPNDYNTIVQSNYYIYGGAANARFLSGHDIIGLLTTQAGITNREATANVWAISGAAAEKDISPESRELAFKYRLNIHIERATNFALPFNALATNFVALPDNLPPEPLESLFHVRVRLGYPLVNNNDPPRRKSYRALVSRNVVSNNIDNTPLFFFVP